MTKKKTEKNPLRYYTGTKTLLAKVLTLGDYNAYRDWDMPDDEDAETEGYLVEYLDGGKANHKEHSGYISWSPKEQFDNAYVESGTAKQRVESELLQLQGKTTDLIKFKHSKKYEALSKIQQRFLRIQLAAMKNYADVLEQRIHIW